MTNNLKDWQILDNRLPIQEFFRPIPLIALSVMVLNDHFLRLKWPNFVTGKLSDFAVVLYFPALLTCCFNLQLYFWNHITYNFYVPKPNPSLTTQKVLWANGITVFILASINLSPEARDFYVWGLEKIDIFDIATYRYTVDPSDLLALLVTPITILDGLKVVKQIPDGRLQWILKRRNFSRDLLKDVEALGKNQQFDQFCQELERYTKSQITIECLKKSLANYRLSQR